MPVEQAEATPDAGSLESGAKALDGLLSKRETKEKVETQPEPVKTQAESDPKQAQPETDEETPSIEAANPEDKEEQQEPVIQPKTFKVKDNGQEVEVTEDEVLKSYLRVQDYTRKTQTLAEEKRKFEESVVTKERERDAQYSQHLEQLKTAVKAFMPVEPDWEARRKEATPEVLAAELLQWQQRQKQIEKIEAEQATVRQRQDADAQRGFEQYVRDEQAKLEEKLPDMKDPEKAKTLRNDLIETGKSYGYSDEDLGVVSDHRLVLILHDAAQFRKAQSKAPIIKNKIEKAIETSAPGSKTSGNKVDKTAALKDKARRTGKAEDSAAVLTAMLDT